MAQQGTGQALRAGIYDRVSSDRRGTRRSVGEQNTENRQAVNENQWRLVAEYCDNDRSASRFARKTRPDWERLVADLDAHQLDVLVMWEPSRGSRDLAPWVDLLATCRRDGVLIHITSHHRTYDVRRSRDWRSLAEDGVDSGYESEKTHERVARTVRAQADAGRPHGRIPYGYRRQYDPSTGSLVKQVPDEKTAPIIQEMARRALAGEALNAIANDLNARGITTPTGRLWELVRVRQILMNPTIAGKRVFQGEVIKDADWEPIIDPDVHAQIVAKLSDPRRITSVDGAVKNLLVGIAVCGVCGATCRRVKNRNTPSYSCSEKHCVARAQWLADEVVTGGVIRRLQRDDARDLLLTDHSVELQEARDEVASLRARLESFYDQAADGQLSAPALARIEAKLLPQIDAADKRIRSFVSSPLIADLIGDDAEQRWEALSMPQRREVVRTLLVPVIHKSTCGKRRDYSSIELRWHAGQ